MNDIVYEKIEDMKFYINNSCVTAKPFSKFEYDVFKYGSVYAGKFIKDNRSGYLIQHSDGTVSWENKKLFEESNVINTALSFGLTLVALELGWKLKRTDWENQYIQIYKDNKLKFVRRYSDEVNEGIWTPTQEDMFSLDWEVLTN